MIKEIKECEQKLDHATGLERIELLNHLGSLYYMRDPDRTFELATEALHLSEALQNQNGLVDSYRLIGVSHIVKGELNAALQATLKSVEMGNGDRQSIGRGNAYSNLGVIYSQLGQHDQALTSYLHSLEIFEHNNEKNGMATAFLNVGNVHYTQQNFEKAQAYYEQALRFAEELEDQHRMAMITNNLGAIAKEHGDLKNALDLFHRSLQIRENLQDTDGFATVSNNVGETYQLQGDYEQALKYFNWSLRYFEKTKNTRGIALAHTNLGAVYTLTKEYEQAFKNLRNALKLTHQITANDLRLDILKLLATLCKTQSKFECALDYYEQYSALREEIFNLEKTKHIDEIEARYQAEKKESEIQHLRNVELVEANRHLAELNREKDEILSIVTHDVKNPLTAILGTAQILQEFDLKAEQVKQMGGAIEVSAKRILSLVQSFLDIKQLELGRKSLMLQPVDVVMAIESSIANIQQVAASKQIQLKFHPPAGNFFILADIQAFHQVLDNLFSNALKFNYPDTTVHISLTSCDDWIEIRIQDQGQGLSEKDLKLIFGTFTRLSAKPTQGEHSTGLGLSIVKKLVEAMQGQVWAESEGKNKGATFVLLMKPASNELGGANQLASLVTR